MATDGAHKAAAGMTAAAGDPPTRAATTASAAVAMPAERQPAPAPRCSPASARAVQLKTANRGRNVNPAATRAAR